MVLFVFLLVTEVDNDAIALTTAATGWKAWPPARRSTRKVVNVTSISSCWPSSVRMASSSSPLIFAMMSQTYKLPTGSAAGLWLRRALAS